MVVTSSCLSASAGGLFSYPAVVSILRTLSKDVCELICPRRSPCVEIMPRILRRALPVLGVAVWLICPPLSGYLRVPVGAAAWRSELPCRSALGTEALWSRLRS